MPPLPDCQTTAAWLKHQTQATLPQARGQVKAMRQLAGRPVLDAAMTEGLLSPAWAGQVIGWTRVLPPELRAVLDEAMIGAVRAGADLDDLAMLARTLIDAWRQQQPDPDDPDDGFDDRGVSIGHTFGGAARLAGDLTPECGAALQAIFDSLGKKKGKEDTRTQAQRPDPDEDPDGGFDDRSGPDRAPGAPVLGAARQPDRPPPPTGIRRPPAKGPPADDHPRDQRKRHPRPGTPSPGRARQHTHMPGTKDVRHGASAGSAGRSCRFNQRSIGN